MFSSDYYRYGFVISMREPSPKSFGCTDTVGLLWPKMQNIRQVSTILRRIQTGRKGQMSPWLPSILVKIHKQELPTSRPLRCIFDPSERVLTVLQVFMTILRTKRPQPVTRRLLLRPHQLTEIELTACKNLLIFGSGNSIDLPGAKFAYCHMNLFAY